MLNDEGSYKTVYKKPVASTSHDDQAVSSSLVTVGCDLTQTVSPVSAMRQQLLSYAITRTNADPDCDPSPTQSWAAPLIAFANSADDLLASPLACFTAWVSRKDDNPALMHVSQQFYLQGLAETRKALLNASLALKDQTLAACLALINYETVECPDHTLTPYRWHREGCARLIQSRGVDVHKDGLGHQLFLQFRRHGVQLPPQHPETCD